MKRPKEQPGHGQAKVTTSFDSKKIKTVVHMAHGETFEIHLYAFGKTDPKSEVFNQQGYRIYVSKDGHAVGNMLQIELRSSNARSEAERGALEEKCIEAARTKIDDGRLTD